MKKNGFTLAELLITLSLIVIIGLIIVNNIVALTNRQDDNEYNEFKTRIEKAACVYAGLEKMKSECGNKSCDVLVKDLISEGLLDDNLYNPKTETEIDIDSVVSVIHDGSKRTCYFSEDNDGHDFIGPNIAITKVYGLVTITVSDTNYLGKYEINTSQTNMFNPTAFGNKKKSQTIYYEPKTAGTYYVHATDQYNNYGVVSSSNSNHPSFKIVAADIDTTPPVITIDSISRGVVKATIYDDVKVKGYTITDSSATPTDYTMAYNKTLVAADIDAGGDSKTITFDPITTAGKYYLHVVDYYGNKTYQEITIDFTKPTITYTVSGTNVAITFKDNLGLKDYFITKLSTLPSDAEWTPLSDKVKQITINETMTETGNYYVYLHDIQDNLVSKNIYVDLAAPVITYNVNGNKFTFNITDDGTLTGFKITTTTATPTTYDPITGKEYNGEFTKSSANTYYIHAVDNNGNATYVQVNF